MWEEESARQQQVGILLSLAWRFTSSHFLASALFPARRSAVAAARHGTLRRQRHSVHASGKICPDGPAAAAFLLPERAGISAMRTKYVCSIARLVRFDRELCFVAKYIMTLENSVLLLNT